jgi:hypothetical protein
MWDSLILEGDDHWLEASIAAGSCTAVTDGSYIREIYPHLCSAAFIFECAEGRGRIVGSFAEQSSAAGAYRGELLGLMAIHLILVATGKVVPSLVGTVTIYSDCRGALEKVSSLPANRIPSRCKHSDILKNIMINCRELSFTCIYKHIRAHQDEHLDYCRLIRPAQLNCQCDYKAKTEIWDRIGMPLPAQEVFPLEPVAVFVDQEKMTSDTGDRIRYWAHRALAKRLFCDRHLFSPRQFEEIAWEHVSAALHSVPRMFQIWACKQVWEIAGTNKMQSFYKEDHDPTCPSCEVCEETCEHVLLCEEEGRVQALTTSIDLLTDWLRRVGTDRALCRCLCRYAKSRGSLSMVDITRDFGLRFWRFAHSQDLIGWRRFMEGMVSKEVIPIQEQFTAICGSLLSVHAWVQGLVIKLLEGTHGQWLYRNVQVHDLITGKHATDRKEQLQQLIEEQIILGGGGLEAEDRYLLEINLEDLETTSGETQQYWLLAILAARKASLLRNATHQQTNQPHG